MIKRYIFAIVLIFTMILSACGAPATTAPEEPMAEEPMAEEPMAEEPMGKYSQAPMLDAKVSSGELPPLEERLPESPFVVGPGIYMTTANLPDWTPGKYGGTLRSSHAVANWNPDIFVMMDEPFLMAPKIGDQGIIPNVAESFEVSDDNTIFTFTLRKGMKWSDGVEVTTEDVRFAWEEIRQNEQLYPTFPSRFKTGFSPNGTPGTLEIIDDYSFKVTFDAPYGAFLRNLTIEGWNGYTEFIEPSHYLKQFHINYTTLEELKPLLDEQGLTEEWWQVFAQKRCQNWDMTNPRCVDYPALNPWIGKATGDSSLMRFERNPYYFKVDTTGQQLPYIDFITSQQVNDMEMVTLKILAGEVDFQRESTALIKMPLYKENEEQAGFRVQLLDMHVDSSGLRIYQTYGEDENWHKLAQDIRFRQALSLAVNRQELIDTVYYGYASLPLQTVGEEFSQYDVDKANALLDEIGISERNADGYRLYEDGSVVEILLEHAAWAPDLPTVGDLTGQYLKDVGILVTVKQIENALWGEKNAANLIQSSVNWSHDVGWGNDIGSGSIGRASVLWNDWISTSGASGEEPPQWIKDIVEIDAKKWAAVPGTDEYNQYRDQAYEWARTNLPYINYVEQVQYPLIINKNLKNVPVDGYAIAANFSVVQMYFDTP